MIAPWYELAHEMKVALGADPAVTVAPLDDTVKPMVALITVAHHAQAVALASLLKPQFDFGNITVVVVVKDAKGAVPHPVVPASGAALADQIRAAFCGNTYFREVVLRHVMGAEWIYPVFARAVIQYPTDNLSDVHFNTNKVAAEAFADLMEHSPGGFPLYFSTDTR